ncbi:hypothetical protein BDW74DRAFT_142692 [Aspergillus multicolor]|uniref:uncharacterized protein n=1 Tax=Aspergillus multicolor TaxID=41759 RepID=UPI003CCD5BB7
MKLRQVADDRFDAGKTRAKLLMGLLLLSATWTSTTRFLPLGPTPNPSSAHRCGHVRILGLLFVYSVSLGSQEGMIFYLDRPTTERNRAKSQPPGFKNPPDGVQWVHIYTIGLWELRFVDIHHC